VNKKKCAVIYHSRWGNCELIAAAVATGLYETGHRPYVAELGSVTGINSDLDAIILGAPTSASRATRQVRLFIKRCIGETQRGTWFAAFGTGLDSELANGNRQSAGEIYELLVEKGLVPLAPPFQAAVKDLKGPPVYGELERAFRFGIDLGTTLRTEDRRGGRGNLRRVI